MHRFIKTRKLFRDSSQSAGFTLIEVLASMAVLLVLMMALMRMFGDASMAFNKGTRTLSRNAAARAALEIVTRDIEGIVVDNRHAFRRQGSTGALGFDEMGHDEIYFVTTAGDQDDGRAYQLVHYYVAQVPAYYGVEEGVLFRLMRESCDLDRAYERGVDAMLSTNEGGVIAYDRQWWRELNALPTNIWSSVLVAENVVRFDIYLEDKNGFNVGDVDSTVAGGCPIDTPPAFFNIYIQVASDDAMQRAGLILKKNKGIRAELVNLAYSELYRDSSTLLRRIVPHQNIQRNHPMMY